jgi:riboflavin kinase/FMN adenylyltransferase
MMGMEMGFEVDAVPLMNVDGPLSSSRIRGMVIAGEVEAAARALGRLHELQGLVVAAPEGKESRIGIASPTLAVSHGLAVPGRGIYLVTASIEGGPELPGVVYVGTRPTFGGVREAIRFHLLDGGDDPGGKVARIRFVGRLRDEHRFDDAESLKAAVEEDLSRARRIFDSRRP